MYGMSVKTWQRIAKVTEGQWGMVTRQQLLNTGISQSTIQGLTAPDSVLERIAEGVYHLNGAPVPWDQQLRAAWLQLAPGVLAQDRTIDQGVVSHRSASTLFFFGDLWENEHEFTVRPGKQSRRKEVKLHVKAYSEKDCVRYEGMWVTRPARIVADLLVEYPDFEAIGQIAMDALRKGAESRANLDKWLAPQARRFHLKQSDGAALAEQLLKMAPYDNQVQTEGVV